ncbi:Endoribonuclease L-PSP/chorismate mutase-like protein [Aspergillus fruticulosus]
MSHLQFHTTLGMVSRAKKNLHYSQSVRIGDRIECSGQKAELALGGWDQVFRVNSYHVPLNDEALQAMVRNFKKYMPNHQPIWTCIGVARLDFDDMRVEIEVTAHDP